MVLGIYAALIFAIGHPKVQGMLATMAEQQLGEMLHTEVNIRRVELGLFNAVELHDVVLYDQARKTILKSKLIYGKIRLTPLFHGKVFLRNIVVLDADISLYRQRTDGPLNIQFIIDAFKTEKKEKSRLDLTVNSLIFRRCQLAFDKHYAAEADSGRFDPDHIRVRDLDVNLSLKELSPDSLNLRVRNLAFTERSGLRLDELRLHLSANRKKAVLRDFMLRTPRSHIRQDHLTAAYDARDFATLRKTFRLNGELNDVLLAVKDAAPFLPQLKEMATTLRINGKVSLDHQRLEIDHLLMHDEVENALNLDADLHIDKGGEGMAAWIYTRRLHIAPALTANVFETFLHQPLPPALAALGNIDFQGKASCHTTGKGEAKQAATIIRGNLTTAAGSIGTQITMEGCNLSAKLSTKDFQTGLLHGHRLVPSSTSLELTAHARLGKDNSLAAADARLRLPEMTIQGVAYHDISAQIDYASRQLNAHLESDNPGAGLSIALTTQLNAAKPMGRMPEALTLKMDVRELNPSRLHLTDRFNHGTFAFSAQAEAKSMASLDDCQAQLLLEHFSLNGDLPNEEAYECQTMNLQAQPSGKGHHLTLRSDFADLEYEGPLKVSQLRELAIMALKNTQPADSMSTASNAEATAASFALAIKDTEVLRRMAGINISQEGTIQANGSIGKEGKDFALSFIAPKVSFGKFALEQISFFTQNNRQGFTMLGKCRKLGKQSKLIAELSMKRNEDGRIQTDIEWMEAIHRKFYGHVCAATRFNVKEAEPQSGSRRKFSINTEFMPTTMCLNDCVWNFEHSWVDFEDAVVSIRNFGLRNGQQHLLVNGNYDRKSTAPIVIDLKNVDLEYILAMARLDVVEFAGHATGRALVRQLEDGSPWASATVNVPDLHFNHAPLGNGNITIGWDHALRDITIDADIREAGQGFTIVKGYVDPVNRDLDLHTESLNTQLGFINKYTEGIFAGISGRATGHCRIHGGFKTISFEGKERGSVVATIPVTGVTYRVENAEIDILPESFVFTKATLRDMENGSGSITGRLEHQHIKNMCYDFKVAGENLRLYDKPRELDMPFYATAKGSGNVHLFGSPGKMNADMNIRTIAGSELTYILDSPDADVSQLLSIRPAEGEQEQAFSMQNDKGNVAAVQQDNGKTDIDLFFSVDVDPQSCLHLITDDKSGDAITVYGQGPIQANYHNKSGFKMFGTYNIERGTYGLNIPMLAQRKKFDILPDGQVNFYGDPTTAEVKVKARYVVNSASLADLNIGTGFANNTTRVDCLVNIYGEVANMQFDLDFDLPNVSEDEKQMVRNLIASDEERTMQVLYLLGVGRFYAYNLSTTEAGPSQSTLMVNSLLSSTLSSQLNSIISNAIGSSNWTFGTNISTGQMGWNDTEVEGLVSSRLLNNRLLINGNFGYSNRQAATTNFVGDFDMQYLITPQGTVSVRAYSETNDRYFTKSTLTTQGVGLQLKRDFTRFKDLFTIRKRKKNK